MREGKKRKSKRASARSPSLARRSDRRSATSSRIGWTRKRAAEGRRPSFAVERHLCKSTDGPQRPQAPNERATWRGGRGGSSVASVGLPSLAERHAHLCGLSHPPIRLPNACRDRHVESSAGSVMRLERRITGDWRDLRECVKGEGVRRLLMDGQAKQEVPAACAFQSRASGRRQTSSSQRW